MSVSENKKVGPSLAAAADIRMKYFEKGQTSLTLKQIKDEVINDYDYLPALEVAFLFLLIDGWYNQQYKVAVVAEPAVPLLEVA